MTSVDKVSVNTAIRLLLDKRAILWEERCEEMEGIIDQAIQFAAVKHARQMRKSTAVPYISHPFAVAMLLQEAGHGAEVVAAGILHDTLEDTSATPEEVLTLFGAVVLKLVEAASEPDKSLPWEDRKRHTMSSLAQRSDDELAVIIADKLHNLRSIRLDIDRHGEKVWSRFNRGKEQQAWYYQGIVNAVWERNGQVPLIADLQKEVDLVFSNA